jgi:ABC-2 type transport system permease protein
MTEPAQETPTAAKAGGASLSQWRALIKRELSAYFLSPMSYLVWMVFLVASGYFFATSIRDGGTATLAPTFIYILFLLVFVAPLTTMHLIAEELKSGTLEVLLTDPVSDAVVILGKYAASLLFFCAMLTPTLAYPLILIALGQPEPGPIASGYLGIVLMGALFLAIGVLTSTLASNQIAAAALSFTVLLLFWALGRAADSLGPGVWQNVLTYLSVFSRFEAFRGGQVDTRSIVYCTTVAGLALFFAVRALGLRRLR